MEYVPLHIHYANVFIRQPKPTGCVWFIQCAFGYTMMQLNDKLRCQRNILQIPNPLHGAIIIQDHLFAFVPRCSSGAKQFLGNFSRGHRSLKLTRSDGFLDEGVDDVTIAHRGLFNGFW